MSHGETLRSHALPGSSRALHRPARVEPLETRRLLSDITASARSSTIADEAGDFLPTYAGPHDPGLDVLAHQTTLAADRLILYGRMAGPVAPTQEVGGLYVWGIDRGRGTPRFRNGTPAIGPNVVWDLIVRVNPDGTGLVNNQVAGVVTPLSPDDIRIDGTNITASVPLSVLMNGATRPPDQWTYNLWPRNGIVPGQNQHVSDLAPDDGNSPVEVLSRPGSVGFGAENPDPLAPPPQGNGAAAGDEDESLSASLLQ